MTPQAIIDDRTTPVLADERVIDVAYDMLQRKLFGVKSLYYPDQAIADMLVSHVVKMPDERFAAIYVAEEVLAAVCQLSAGSRIKFVAQLAVKAPERLSYLMTTQHLPARARQSVIAPLAAIARASLAADIFSPDRVERVQDLLAEARNAGRAHEVRWQRKGET